MSELILGYPDSKFLICWIRIRRQKWTGATTLVAVRYGTVRYLDQADKELGVEHEDGLVLPGRLAVQVHAVQHVLHHRVRHNRQQDGVLKPEHKL